MIKFYAKEDTLVRVPGAQPRPGQPDMYVGRDFDPERRGYFISENAFEVDENTDAGKRLVRLAKVDNCLYPADRHTAEICGMEFVPLTFSGGIFVKSKPIADSKIDKS